MQYLLRAREENVLIGFAGLECPAKPCKRHSRKRQGL